MKWVESKFQGGSEECFKNEEHIQKLANIVVKLELVKHFEYRYRDWDSNPPSCSCCFEEERYISVVIRDNSNKFTFDDEYYMDDEDV